ncbi:hypothetical protein BAUCODRAFT_29709 [Baudoinia panamericana UAMH 10762]|uniref:Uncharacterized protein n=1 Tax=Baudoinia panamericana (strain UAMH 10762) TaxID=717646 RepID=M2NQD7_BAUPA|nr:uncharacterized protein BAUCODRAFT_29709 [Baudoinia panamericana UAMH 10762]EMD01261.1 hypothetical protein BAUCODRAFT_29709 [Baudoinia panamericana UAMH 10762]
MTSKERPDGSSRLSVATNTITTRAVTQTQRPSLLLPSGAVLLSSTSASTSIYPAPADGYSHSYGYIHPLSFCSNPPSTTETA